MMIISHVFCPCGEEVNPTLDEFGRDNLLCRSCGAVICIYCGVARQ